ncbi:MAG: acyl-CoA thioesterase II [Corynebacterium sp.]|nr:acyl-CoA thioesterase II [Corynebacterium sp.]
MASIDEILNLEEIDRNIYRGPIVPTAFQRTFGGQIAAQALVAATKTVDRLFKVNSLHGYFLGAGEPRDHTLFLVERNRDGRSFASRTVNAVQHGKTIFTMQASFNIGGAAGIEHFDRMRETPGPDEVKPGPLDGMTDTYRALLEEWSDWDIRIVPQDVYSHNPYTASQQLVWFRSNADLPADPMYHVCTLAYMSDMTLLQTALVPHPGLEVQEASLDHAMWFLRPFRADEWLLYDQVSPSAADGRALSYGKVYDQEGRLVAAVMQEGITRLLREGAKAVPMTNLASKPTGSPRP